MKSIIISGVTVMLGLFLLGLGVEQTPDRKYTELIELLSKESPHLHTEGDLLLHYPSLQQIKNNLIKAKQLQQRLSRYSHGPTSKGGQEIGVEIVAIRKSIDFLLSEINQQIEQLRREIRYVSP